MLIEKSQVAAEDPGDHLDATLCSVLRQIYLFIHLLVN